MRIRDYIILNPEQKRIFTMWKKHKSQPSYSFSWKYYWCENGGFIQTLPRRFGKTTLIKKMALQEDINHLIVFPTPGLSHYDSRFNCKPSDLNSIRGVNYSETDLFVDEFCCFKKENISELLNNQWRSVTMLGTFYPGVIE